METVDEIIEEFDTNSEEIFEQPLEESKITVYQCNGCNINFSDIAEHIKIYHTKSENVKKEDNDEEIVFEEISATEGEEDELNLALVVQNDKGMYECKECSKTFKVYNRFMTHLRSHHSMTVEDFGAYDEPSTSTNIPKKDLKKYMEIKTVNSDLFYCCKRCDVEFDSRKKLLLHLSVHKKESTHPEVTVTSDNINCKLCNKTFNCKFDYELHVQTHDETKLITEKNPKQPSQKGVYSCQYCGKEFKRPHEKVRHERIHSGVKPYSCDICGKQFRVTYCLKLHKQNVHSDDRPYICTFPGCNKRFKTQSVYNHHINGHSDERKFQCPFCSKTFKTSVQLAGHKNTHIKPFSCTICKRPFSSLYAVKNHMGTHMDKDSNLTITCKVCGAQYARQFALKEHMRAVHPDMEYEIDDNETDVTELYMIALSSEVNN